MGKAIIPSAEDAEKGSSIRLLACQIHFGYGGSELDNWLEAESTLSNN